MVVAATKASTLPIIAQVTSEVASAGFSHRFTPGCGEQLGSILRFCVADANDARIWWIASKAARLKVVADCDDDDDDKDDDDDDADDENEDRLDMRKESGRRDMAARIGCGGRLVKVVEPRYAAPSWCSLVLLYFSDVSNNMCSPRRD